MANGREDRKIGRVGCVGALIFALFLSLGLWVGIYFLGRWIYKVIRGG